MAKMTVSGIDELMLSMKQVAELPDSVANDMLQAAGKIVRDAQTRKVKSSLGVRTGALAKAITVTPKVKTRKGGERYVTVYPKGTHHINADGTKVTNNEVFFVNEFGAPKRGIAAKGMARAANEESAEKATAAQAEVYDKWLQSKNL
jgi:hypothetical protein